jgi:hypothetical protein
VNVIVTEKVPVVILAPKCHVVKDAFCFVDGPVEELVDMGAVVGCEAAREALEREVEEIGAVSGFVGSAEGAGWYHADGDCGSCGSHAENGAVVAC